MDGLPNYSTVLFLPPPSDLFQIIKKKYSLCNIVTSKVTHIIRRFSESKNLSNKGLIGSNDRYVDKDY